MNKIAISNRQVIAFFLLFNEILYNGYASDLELIKKLNFYMDVFLSMNNFNYLDEYFRFAWRCINAEPSDDFRETIKVELERFDSTDEFVKIMAVFTYILLHLEEFETITQKLEKNLIQDLQYNFNIQSVMMAGDSIHLNFPIGVKPEFEGIRNYLYADWYGHADFPYRLTSSMTFKKIA